jgi:hypothetical protein
MDSYKIYVLSTLHKPLSWQASQKRGAQTSLGRGEFKVIVKMILEEKFHNYFKMSYTL